MTRRKFLEAFETLDEYITTNGKPWTVGNARGEIPSDVEALIIARWNFDRLSIRKNSANYVEKVEALFKSIAYGAMWNVLTTFQTRDEILGSSAGVREATRTGYAAPNGNVNTAYVTGREIASETLPMSETVDRALAAQDGMKDAIEEAARCFTFAFLGVLA